MKMDRFIKECRREWKRLRVPEAVAGEMAADLTADLREAESEGVSAEEVLGSGVFDPRSFAASWAIERGVVDSTVQQRTPWRSPLLVAIVASAIIAAIGGGLVMGSRLGSPGVVPLAGPPFSQVVCRPFRVGFPVPSQIRREVRVPNCPRPAFALPGPARISVRIGGQAGSQVGWILFIVGIIGIVLSMLMWWVIPGPWSRRRTDMSETQSGAS